MKKILGKANYKNVAYGNLWIDSSIPCIAKWTLKINCIGKSEWPWRANIFISLSSKEVEWEKDTSLKRAEGSIFYVLKGNDMLSYGQDDKGTIVVGQHRLKFRIDDQVILKLNTKEKTISVKVDNEDDKCIFDDVIQKKDIKYKLSIILHDSTYSVTLLDFDFMKC